MAMDSQKNLYVIDYDSNGGKVWNSQGNQYEVDYASDGGKVWKVDINTMTMTLFAGGNNGTLADDQLAVNAFIHPSSIVISSKDIAYISDTNHQCIRSVDIKTNIIDTNFGML
jgi:hypothetical protein